MSSLPPEWEGILLVLITLIAAAVRFYRLAEVPPGLHFDEAFKGVMAQGLLEGGPLQIFFASNQGEEPLAVYLVATALRLFGQEPWVIRLPSAVIGTLTIPLAWWLGRGAARLARQEMPTAATSPGVKPGQLGADLGEQMVGLGSALVLAILYWHVSFSRLGMEPILVPFFAVLAFAALAHGLNASYEGRPAYPAFALAGLGLGGGLYTYKAGYVTPLVAASFLAYAAILERGFLRRHGRGLLILALAALLVLLPLALYFVAQPQDFLHRPTDVALVAGSRPEGSWQAIVDNIPRVLGMFFVKGDTNPRSNLPGRPALDPFLALLFLVGLGRASFGFRRPAQILPLLWLGIMVIPTLVTEYAPHFARAIGATPAVALLCATGGRALWQGTARLRLRWAAAAVAACVALGLGFSGIATGRAYFQTWGRSPDLFYAYDVGLVEIADYVRTIPQDEGVYLTPLRPDHYTLQFLAGRPWATFDGRAGLVLPPPGQAATLIVFSQEDAATPAALAALRPDAVLSHTWTDAYGRPYAEAYYLPKSHAQTPLPEHPSGAVLGGAVELIGYALDSTWAQPGDTVTLTLYWRVLAAIDQDYTVFTHLLGTHNPATGGPVWAGHDSQPDGGHYPTTAWRPGEIVLDVHPLTIPADAPSGRYELEAGLYLLATMARLPAQDAAGAPLPDDAIPLGTMRVGP